MSTSDSNETVSDRINKVNVVLFGTDYSGKAEAENDVFVEDSEEVCKTSPSQSPDKPMTKQTAQSLTQSASQIPDQSAVQSTPHLATGPKSQSVTQSVAQPKSQSMSQAAVKSVSQLQSMP